MLTIIITKAISLFYYILVLLIYWVREESGKQFHIYVLKYCVHPQWSTVHIILWKRRWRISCHRKRCRGGGSLRGGVENWGTGTVLKRLWISCFISNTSLHKYRRHKKENHWNTLSRPPYSFCSCPQNSQTCFIDAEGILTSQDLKERMSHLRTYRKCTSIYQPEKANLKYDHVKLKKKVIPLPLQTELPLLYISYWIPNSLLKIKNTLGCTETRYLNIALIEPL